MLASLATAEDAALCFARSPEERVVAERTAAVLLTSEEALQHGLTDDGNDDMASSRG